MWTFYIFLFFQVRAQSPAPADDLYLEDQASGDFPVDDDDFNSGSGSGKSYTRLKKSLTESLGGKFWKDWMCNSAIMLYSAMASTENQIALHVAKWMTSWEAIPRWTNWVRRSIRSCHVWMRLHMLLDTPCLFLQLNCKESIILQSVALNIQYARCYFQTREADEQERPQMSCVAFFHTPGDHARAPIKGRCVQDGCLQNCFWRVA